MGEILRFICLKCANGCSSIISGVWSGEVSRITGSARPASPPAFAHTGVVARISLIEFQYIRAYLILYAGGKCESLGLNQTTSTRS
jgi:hypothetical protein